MTEYALVGPDGEVKTYSRAVRPDVGTKTGWRWLPVERSTAVVDPKAETLGDEVVTVRKNAVTVSREARRKTEDELALERASELEEQLPLLLSEILSDIDNRLRAVEGKAPQGPEEFRDAVLGARS